MSTTIPFHTSALSKPKKPWRETPLIESANLSKAAGCRIFLKLETLQPSGSFKSRGLGHLISKFLSSPSSSSSSSSSSAIGEEQEEVHFFCSSGGNAGLAAVHAARAFGRAPTVVVPVSAAPHMLAKLRAAGAEDVVRHGASWREADAYMREVVMPTAEQRGSVPGGTKGGVKAVYVPPFDHPDVWEGHATLVTEVDGQLRAMGEASGPEVMVCSCGGGGLFAGVMMGIEGLGKGKGWDRTTVVVANTVGADALPQSLAAGENVTIPGITSIALSLGATRVADKAFELAQTGVAEGKVKSVVLTDAEAAMGCWRFADDERILVEPACGVNLALCYGGRLEKALGRPVKPDDKVVIVVCGGQNVSTEAVEGWRQKYGDLDAGKTAVEVPSSTTAPGAQS